MFTYQSLSRCMILIVLCLPLAGCNEIEIRQGLSQLSNPPGEKKAPLSTAEIGSGIREALRIGSERVVGQLGRADGFNADNAVRILLPEKLAKARGKAAKFGLERHFDDLEVRFNRAAEAAAPQAREIFRRAIAELTLDDVRGILQGPNDAATRYFQRKTTQELTAAMRPVIDDSLDRVGAVRAYRQLGDKINAVPMIPRIDTDLTGHVTTKALDGLFLYLAREEGLIRNDPAKRTTELLRRVFSTSR